VSSGKRAVKDLPAHTAQSVKGGAKDGSLDAGVSFKKPARE